MSTVIFGAVREVRSSTVSKNRFKVPNPVCKAPRMARPKPVRIVACVSAGKVERRRPLPAEKVHHRIHRRCAGEKQRPAERNHHETYPSQPIECHGHPPISKPIHTTAMCTMRLADEREHAQPSSRNVAARDKIDFFDEDFLDRILIQSAD